MDAGNDIVWLADFKIVAVEAAHGDGHIGRFHSVFESGAAGSVDNEVVVVVGVPEAVVVGLLGYRDDVGEFGFVAPCVDRPHSVAAIDRNNFPCDVEGTRP